MKFIVGPYILDSYTKSLIRSDDSSLVTDNDRAIQALTLLVEAYPETVSKDALMNALWPDETTTEWSLSRLISDLRQTLAAGGSDLAFIKTVHRKGFRLLVPVKEMDAEQIFSNSAPDTSINLRKRRRLIIAAAVAALCSVAALYLTLAKTPRQSTLAEPEPVDILPTLPITGKVIAARTIHIPLPRGWAINDEPPREIDEKGLRFRPTGGTHVVSKVVQGPGNFQQSILRMRLVADEALINSRPTLHLFAQSFRDTWPGEWNCQIDVEQLAQPRDVECVIDEPGTPFALGPDDYIGIGVRSTATTAEGSLWLQSAELYLPESISVDSGWRASHNLGLRYDRGVSFSPTRNGQRLAYDIAGPAKLQGKALAITLEADQVFIDSGADLQPFAQRTIDDWRGEWNCWINNADLLVSGDTYYCLIDEPDDYFNMREGDYLHLGIQAHGKKVAGTVKIRGVNIISSMPPSTGE